MSKILYSSDNSPKALQAGDYALNTSTNEIIQMTEISSAIFGNDKHLLKLQVEGDNLLYNGKIVGFFERTN